MTAIVTQNHSGIIVTKLEAEFIVAVSALNTNKRKPNNYVFQAFVKENTNNQIQSVCTKEFGL